MGLPWVTRSAYEKALADVAECKEDHRQLLAQYHSMAIAAASTVTAAIADVPVVRSMSESAQLIHDVVMDQSRGDPRLAAYLRTYASRMRRDGKTAEEIADALQTWTTTEPMEH